jgi:tRNA (cytidine/uridine-2'-O-)-methyltransferase
VFEVVLFSPRIPPNTGNVIRLCANTGCRLHLVEPLGFVLDEARVRRAGLDYHDMAVVTTHPSLEAARAVLADRRWFATTARGGSPPHEVELEPGDVFLFGPEPTGLPDDVLDQFGPDRRLSLPMPAMSSLSYALCASALQYAPFIAPPFSG